MFEDISDYMQPDIYDAGAKEIATGLSNRFKAFAIVSIHGNCE